MNRWTSKLPLLLVAAAVTVSATAVDATTLLQTTARDQIDGADLIFVGTVVDKESIPTGDGAFAFTLVTFEVEDTLKGSTRDRLVTLRFAGGPVGEDVFEVAGIPTFEPGDRHLLFVAGNRQLGCPLVGWTQGKLDFVAHPLSGETILVDFRGQAVGGIEGGRWQFRGPALTTDQMLRRAAEPGVTVVAEDGVEITVEPVGDALVGGEQTAAVPAADVVAKLRAAVRRRAGTSTFRSPQVTESATAADVPAVFQFQAHPGSGR